MLISLGILKKKIIVLDAKLDVLKDIDNVWVRFYIKIKINLICWAKQTHSRVTVMQDENTANSEEIVELFDYTVNMCRFLVTQREYPIMRTIYAQLMKYGNIFTECPI